MYLNPKMMSPPNREICKTMLKYLFCSFLFLLCVSAQADSLVSAVTNCKKITEDKERLNCFDQIQPIAQQSLAQTQQSGSTPIAAPVAQTQQQSSATPDTARVQPPAAEQLVDSFGKEHKIASASQQQNNIVLKLIKVKTTPLGSSIFTFENGQVWRQVSTEYFYAEVGKNYEIERGAFNSFFLSEQGKRKEIKVRRDK